MINKQERNKLGKYDWIVDYCKRHQLPLKEYWAWNYACKAFENMKNDTLARKGGL